MQLHSLLAAASVFWLAISSTATANALEHGFAHPPHAAKPWVFWFWINGNISKTGITADLEALQQAGIGGVLWMEVSGPWWAPDGPVKGGSPEWHEAMQWAIQECARLGLEFDLSLDFGYGSGGPHITPDRSMQRLLWSETEIAGGFRVDQVLPRGAVETKNLSAWLRPGAAITPQVLEQIENIDSYRDVAVVAIPASAQGKEYRIPEIGLRDGTSWKLPAGTMAAPPPDAVTPLGQVIDLTSRMQPDGRLTWDAPPGRWLVLRFGHASNFKMTRPCPTAAIGLECDRLGRVGIETHYRGFLQQIFTGAGPAAGKALSHVHIDSWEAGGQNWTATFPAEFLQRRGYDLRPWLPVLAGRVVGDVGLSERFLWDVRKTVSEMIRDNYARRLRELALPHGIRLSTEAYGHLCIDNLEYAGVADFPISEFWARGDGLFPAPGGYESTTKVMASAAHTYGKPVIGAEAFTSDRGWRDHPYLLKGMGDGKFCEGLNRVIFHLSAHQAYPDMVPGLTHRKWGEHIQRNNTWWPYIRPWTDYLARCQYLLQQGSFVADVCCCPGEGAPVDAERLELKLPAGYDFDFCSAELLLQAEVRDGRVALPSGAAYRYLFLPETARISPALARKLQALVQAGARVLAGPRPVGAPGLTDFPRCDAEVETVAAALWDTGSLTSGSTADVLFTRDRLLPDFEGAGLRFIHRRAVDTEIYFVSNPLPQDCATTCGFRVTGKHPELWNPETGTVRPLPEFREEAGRIWVPLRFEPMQSWFVVFRGGSAQPPAPAGSRNFASWREQGAVGGPWKVGFDPKWGGPAEPVVLDALLDWSQHADPRIRFYSGTAIYRSGLDLTAEVADPKSRAILDLGAVEVMARVRVNGVDCGIAWKPPYRVDISKAAHAGRNELEIAVVNLWINRLVGDEQLPLDGEWKDSETLLSWPDWFRHKTPRISGRTTFTSCRHYGKATPLVPSGLLGPVWVLREESKQEGGDESSRTSPLGR